MRTIPLYQIKKNYPQLCEIAKIFNHEVIEDDHGVYRWKPNRLMNYLSDEFPPNGVANEGTRFTLDLNRLQIDMLKGKFSVEEKMKFSMQRWIFYIW